MGLVQGREDGMETPWQEIEPALELELLSPKIYFLFLICFLFTHVPLPAISASRQRQGSRIHFYIRRGGAEVSGYKLDSKAQERTWWGLCIKWPQISLMTRTVMCTRQPLPAGEPREKRA